VNQGSSPRALPPEHTLVVLIGLYLMLQPLATDFYLASLPGLTRTFATTAATAQLTLSVFVLAFGLMQLVAGPLADRYGRRPVLLAGLALYVLACLACALAPTIGILIAGRFVQAVGCCAVVVVARAIIRDAFDPEHGARVLAQASTIIALGPLLGPILGSVLEVNFGHRAAFLVIGTIAAVLLVATLSRLPETNRHPDPRATRLQALAAGYAAVARSPAFRANTLAGAASYGGVFAFLSGSPFVLTQVLGVPTAWFGVCFALAVSGYLLGTIVCRRLLARRSVIRTMRVGAALALIAAIAMVALAAAGVHHWAALVLPQFVYFMAHGINFPCAQVGSIAPFERRAGAAAGLFGFLLMIAASLIGIWIGASWNGTVYPLVLTIAAVALVVFVTVNVGIAQRTRASPA
jgi:DHA1 family bicyclomycin/chloramphenicol resistance-like MFS transporter